ncbi:TorF family putative porin [Sphingomonas radiodurans]|uniref:TorF family putative porin n=1 Tax=Sphingomonas radiodurans TaxID=2890321 RepID=UPI001E54338C|nr:TorF family putative porin [Sphingomonas radiodurans]WBH15211.1 TorF family putative porin [Sphingomonas radiodurans]
MKYLKYIPAAMLAAFALPASAQDAEPPKPITVSGSVGLVSDYRFRGVSQSDEELAVQGGFTIAHESGVYIGTWGSNLAGWGTFGGANMELDLVAGYKRTFDAVTVDIGATWYMYPGGFDNTDFIEPYIKVSGTLGPASLTAGLAYAPKQEALGAWYFNGTSAFNGVYDDPGDKNDNLYLWVDGTAGVPNTPITLKGHVGFSKGNSGLGPFATSVAPTGEYMDWLLGADLAVPGTPLTLGVAYVDTDINDNEAFYLQPSFSKGQDGDGSIANGKVVVSLTAVF